MPTRDDITEEWGKLHREELNDLHSSSNIVRVIKRNVMGGTCSTYEEMTGVYRSLVGKPDERGPA